ncbi:MAG: hypothetical protein ACREJX_05380 [Polyangiaceae bacterium]
MRPRTSIAKRLHDATIAYAANARGDGVAYVALAGEATPRRITFQVDRLPALMDREVGYAALVAVADALWQEGYRRVQLGLADERVAQDLAERRSLPMALSLLYVRLKCRLNTFIQAQIVVRTPSDDLANRARAEVELSAAA